jgi:hypothetical protein
VALLGTNQVPTLYYDQNLLPLNRHVNMNFIGLLYPGRTRPTLWFLKRYGSISMHPFLHRWGSRSFQQRSCHFLRVR